MNKQIFSMLQYIINIYLLLCQRAESFRKVLFSKVNVNLVALEYLHNAMTLQMLDFHNTTITKVANATRNCKQSNNSLGLKLTYI